MPLEEDLGEDNTSSPAANDTQVPQATATDAEEDIKCPICLDTISNEASIGICGHIFCFYCILEWSRISAVCPICRQPFHHLYRKVGPTTYEVYQIVQDTRRATRSRSRPHSEERRWRHSSSRQHRSSSSRDLSSSSGDLSSSSGDLSSSSGDRSSSSGDRSFSSGDRSTGRVRGRRRSRRQHHDGHSRAHRDSLSSRRGQQRRAQDTADEGPAPRPERDISTSSRRSEPHQRGGRASSREWQPTWNRLHWRSRSIRHRRQWEHQRRRGQHHDTRSRSQQRSRRAW